MMGTAAYIYTTPRGSDSHPDIHEFINYSQLVQCQKNGV